MFELKYLVPYTWFIRSVDCVVPANVLAFDVPAVRVAMKSAPMMKSGPIAKRRPFVEENFIVMCNSSCNKLQ